MEINIRAFEPEDIDGALAVWNSVVADGIAFPQTEILNETDGLAFFGAQSFCGVATDGSNGQIVGLYILHPNNVGRCAHICNASYAVAKGYRGNGIGEACVRHCLSKAKELGFRILQFNAVVSTNTAALKLYEKLGFIKLGVIRGGFLMKDNTYCDIIPHYREL